MTTNTHVSSILQTVGDVKQSSHRDHLLHVANLLHNASHSTSQNPSFLVLRSNARGKNEKRRKKKKEREKREGKE